MITLKSRLFFVLLLTILFVVPNRGGNHTVSTTIEVSQTAINRYLNTQYNLANFPKNTIVNISGIDYTISLKLPNVVLTVGNAKLYMVFDVWQGSQLVYHFVVQPSINIPAGQTSASQIQAKLTNLQATLDAITPLLPAWIKTNIISVFNTRDWSIYPSKLLDEISTTWFGQRGLAINITDLSLEWEVLNSLLKLKLSIPMTATTPSFNAQIGYDLNANPVILMRSFNINVTVDEVRIYNQAGTLIQTRTDDILLSKGINGWFYTNFTPSLVQNYYVWILFRTDNTFMVRKYKMDGQGHGSELFSSVN